MKTTATADRTFVRLHVRESQRRKRIVALVASILSLCALLWVWYSTASDYSYKALAGTYTLRMKDESSTLVLKEDGSFQHKFDRSGRQKFSQGTWRRIGEGGIVFSSEFLSTSGQEVVGNGEIYGDVEKTLGFFPTIHIHHNPNEPVYHRHLLS